MSRGLAGEFMESIARLSGSRSKRLRLLVAVALAALAVSACGTRDTRSGTSGADVSFATGMTQHHAQTMQLVNLAALQSLPARQWVWTDSVRQRRLLEITQLTRMLRQWHRPVPETGLQHSDEGKHLRFDPTVPGILAEEQIEGLHRLRGQELARQWLRLFIDHEQGAVRLAAAEVTDGTDLDAVRFAKADRDQHAAVVARLRALLASVHG